MGEEGGWQSGGDKATCAQLGEGAAEHGGPLAKGCEPGQDSLWRAVRILKKPNSG